MCTIDQSDARLCVYFLGRSGKGTVLVPTIQQGTGLTAWFAG
jgi:hypothetical protein